jgi:hypothetical protein
MNGTQKEMPRYKCHKEVWALKIGGIETRAEGVFIVPVEDGYAAFRIDQEYIEKHKPRAGGYYVVYKGGYKSFSPAEAFEDGYTLVE